MPTENTKNPYYEEQSAANEHEVEGTVPSQWWLDLKVENQQLRARLSVAEAYIPSRDFADYQGDADRAAAVQEIIEAAREFVATTSVFRQPKASRDAFTRLAVALIEWRKENDPDA